MKTIMKLNALTIAAIIVILLVHAVMASGTALGLWSNMGLFLTKPAFYLVFLHLGLATVRTMQHFVPELRSKTSMKEYLEKNGGVPRGFISMVKKAELGKKMKRQNVRFWMTRFTGVLFLVLMFVHEAWIWRGPVQAGVLKYILLGIQLLYILAIFVHVSMNLHSLSVKLGFGKNELFKKVFLAVFTGLMLFIASGMVCHFMN